MVDYILKNEIMFMEENKNERFHVDNMMAKLSQNPIGFIIKDKNTMESGFDSFMGSFGLDPSAVLCLAGMINR